jgi:hypothetical protein
MADLSVLYIDPETRRVSFQLSPRPVSGIDLLVQMVVLGLFASPDTDILDPQEGGGLEDLISMNVEAGDTSEIYAEIARRVSTAQDQIIRNQIGLDISSEEKLRKITIVSVEAGEPDEVKLKLSVENEVGRTRDIVV